LTGVCVLPCVAVLVVRIGECVREVTKIIIAMLVAGAAVGCRAGPVASVHVADMRSIEVRMVAHDTTWHAAYIIEEPAGRAAEVPTGREVHVPLGAEVTLALTSTVYISDFALPDLGLRDFAAPGLPSELRFRADRPGRYVLRGDELCGRPHDERSRGVLIVEEPPAFRAWLQKRTRESLG
jgi:heme/copper-type cytochrome/quinol oxidase subunit 2